MCNKILVLCTIEAGLDSVAHVIHSGYSDIIVVGLSPLGVDDSKVSGYVDVKEFANKNNINYTYVESYDLTFERDKILIQSLDYSMIWVAGWQRLIPKWLIESAQFGAFGGHGSVDGITLGRGRSPQNWAIMLGCKRFVICLFIITPGIDDGPVISSREFIYNDHDDIRVSYYKVSLAMADMICELLDNPKIIESAIQQKGISRYFPQRVPSDGVVDWSLGSKQIVRHCLALTRPYPGLRTCMEGDDVVIWKCQEFDEKITEDNGVITSVFLTSDFIVSCGDGRILVREWSCQNSNWFPKVGKMFESVPYRQQMLNIISRHSGKYPANKLNKRILNQLQD